MRRGWGHTDLGSWWRCPVTFHFFCSSIESKRIKSFELACRRWVVVFFCVFFFLRSMGTGRGLGVTLSASGNKSFLFQFYLWCRPKPLQNDAEHQRSTTDARNRVTCLIRGATLPPSGEASNSRSVHTSNLMIGCPPAGDGQLHASDWWARRGGQTADCRVSHREDGPSAAGSFHTSAILCQGRSPLMFFF